MIKVNENENSEFWEGLITWWESNHRSFPWRETKNSYFILISEILLQKTAAAPVIDVYRKVIQGYPNVDALAKADESHLTELISPIGLRKRSKKLIAIAQEIVNKYDGHVPEDRDALLSLPGVGSYTADAVRCFAYDVSVVPVDTNTIRIAERVFGLKSNLSRPRRDPQISLTLSRLQPKDSPRKNVLSLLDFAQEICKAKQPRCSKCFWKNKCISQR